MRNGGSAPTSRSTEFDRINRIVNSTTQPDTELIGALKTFAASLGKSFLTGCSQYCLLLDFKARHRRHKITECVLANLGFIDTKLS